MYRVELLAWAPISALPRRLETLLILPQLRLGSSLGTQGVPTAAQFVYT